MKKYNLIVSGGTFDKFHKGHRDFLNYQLSLSEEVLVGITSDEYAQEKVPERIDTFTVRHQTVVSFLQTIGAEDRVRLEKIDTAGIPAVWVPLPIEAIVVTEDTKTGAAVINTERKKNRLPVLPIEVSPITPAADGKPIASHRIRNGEITRDGTVCLSEALTEKTLLLPDSLREELQKPFGTLIIGNAYDYASLSMQDVLTVGDVATKTFVERNLIPRLSIVDLVIERRKTYTHHTEIGFTGQEKVLSVENPPGSLSASLLQAVFRVFNDYPIEDRIVITVTGEEDLAVIPVLLRAPLGNIIFYGQPREGIVKVEVTEERKTYARHLLEKFKK